MTYTGDYWPEVGHRVKIVLDDPRDADRRLLVRMGSLAICRAPDDTAAVRRAAHYLVHGPSGSAAWRAQLVLDALKRRVARQTAGHEHGGAA